MKRIPVLLATLSLLLTGMSLVATGETASAAGQQAGVRLHQAIRGLPVAAETRTGYVRSRFQMWVDADNNCRDTRDEVLARQSLVWVGTCDVRPGRWLSYYDNQVFKHSSGLDIDHMVPLAEAWDSGAKKWNADTRKRYANDLANPRSLVAVSASSNRSKGDRDPADWMPAYGTCRYIQSWVTVKLRWSLKVDRREKRQLVRLGDRCANSMVRWRKAVIGTGGSSAGGTSGGSTPPATGGTDRRYSYCYQAVAAGLGPYYRGRDPEYDWYTDADGDGVVCE